MQNDSLERPNQAWWQKPGIGIMYQIEARPGWIWERDFDKFNASMKDELGNLNFNGPFCRMKEWVNFSKAIGVDYHIFESKWHDGICYFNTKFTNWKTPINYCKIFAEESKRKQIPFMFYYSSVFDHNPQFDEIQPVRTITPSFIALHRETKEEVVDFCLKFAKIIINLFIETVKRERSIKNIIKSTENNENSIELNINDFNNLINQSGAPINIKITQFTYDPERYETFLKNQLIELIEFYQPDGMWMDWYMKSDLKEGSTKLIMNLMKERYPNTILAFNNSINEQPKWAHYLSGEAHTVNSAWKQANKYRSKTIPWELVGPVAKSWFDPSPRSDPLEISRIAVIIMANGGKYCFGLPSQMDGSLYPEPAEHIQEFGKWYQLRREFFTEASPMNYRGYLIPGIEINYEDYRIIGSVHGNYKLIHLINFLGKRKNISLNFSRKFWNDIVGVKLEPYDVELELKKNEQGVEVTLSQEDVDPIDTILRIIQ